MSVLSTTLPGMPRRVERAITWVTVVATIAWSIGLSFLIKVPIAHAAVTIGLQPGTDNIGGYKIAIRDLAEPIIAVVWQMSSSASETFISLGYTVTQVAGTVDSTEIGDALIYGPTGACSGAELSPGTGLFLCGKDSSVNVGSADSILVDNNGDGAGGGNATIQATQGTWALVIQPGVAFPLDNSDAFTVTLATSAMTSSLGSGLPAFGAQFVSDTFTFTTAAADSTAPAAGAGGPPDGMIGAPPDAIIDRTFGEALVPSRVNGTNVTLKQCLGLDHSATTSATAATTACATVGSNLCASPALTDSSTRVACTPAAALALDRWHEFRIGTGVIDASGNAITEAIYRFKTGSHGGTGSAGNQTAPTIISQTPMPGQATVPINTNLSASFSVGPESDMKTTVGGGGANAIDNVANVSVKKIVNFQPVTEVCTSGSTCALSWNTTARVLGVDPTANLDADAEYDFCIRSTAQNAQGVGLMGDRCVRFRTSAGAADMGAPTLRTGTPTTPANGTTDVSPFNEIRASFSKDMDQTTLSLSTVRLCADSTALTAGCEAGDARLNAAANFSTRYDLFDRTFVLAPVTATSLAASTRYCIEVIGGASGAKDSIGNAFAATASVNCFTTGAATDPVAGAPKVLYADCDNNKCVIHFSEPMRATDLVASGNVNTSNVALATITDGNATSMSLSGKTAIYRGDSRELEIQGLGLATDQQIRITITNAQDLATNAIDTANSNNITNALALASSATGGNLGSAAMTQDFNAATNFATFWEHPSRCFPRALATGKSTTVECEFSAPTALTTGAKLVLSFPSGFTVTDAAAVAATQSFMNKDLNGPGPGTTTISGVVADNGARTVTVTLAHATPAMGSEDHLRFELSGITTPTTPLTDARVSIIVKNSSGVKVGSTINAAPFSIQEAGSLSIVGKVCKGATTGATCGDADTGIANLKVFCSQMGGFSVGSTTSAFMGHQEATTNAQGTFSLTGLTPGQYGCNIPPDPTKLAETGGMPPYQQVSISAVGATTNKACGQGNRSDCVDFKFKDISATGKTLTITVSGLNDADSDADDFDVFCHAGFSSFEFSAPVMKAVDAETAGNTTETLKLQGGQTYECGMGPHIAFEQFQGGGPPPMPDFDFMPPKPVQVVVPSVGEPAGITFNVSTTSLTIAGTVTDGDGNGIGSAYVHAAPVGCFDATTGAQKDCFGSFAQTKSDGTYTLKVGPGTYEIGADAPGLPPSTREEVTVTTAGGSVSGKILKMVKSSTTVSGQVLDDSGNGIKYAHVNAEKRTITTGSDACDFANSRPSGGWADSPTDSSGNYTLYTGNGTWCIRAFAPAYGEVGTKTVTVSGSSLTGQNLQASAGDYGTVSGTVTKGGTATGGAFVNCFGSSGGNHAQVSADGTYSMKLKAGTYTCDGFMPGVGPLPRASSVVVTASTTTTQAFTVGNPATITVTITNITDAFCDARDASGFGSPAGKPSSTGVYTINVPAGTYTVRCGGPKYGQLVEQTGVVVTAGGTATASGTAPTTRAVTGRITDGTSNVSGATLAFTDTADPRKNFTVQTGSQSSTTCTSSDTAGCNLSTTGIPEGTYTVTASKKGYVAASTTATVSGGALTLASPIAMTAASGANGTSATITVQESSSAYTGNAKVIATKGTKTVVADIDSTTGLASAPLTNGTWTVKAVGDNGKESSSSTVTVSGSTVTGTTTYSLANTISGYTQKSESGTLSLSGGGLLKFNDLAVGGKAPEVNVPSSTLSTSDSSTGKVEMSSNVTVKDIDPGTDTNFVGSHGYDITAKDANGSVVKDLNGSITVTIPYTDADVSAANVEESKLQVATFNTSSQTWESFPTTVDTTNNLLIAQVGHFSSFGVIGSQTTGGITESTPPAAPTNIGSSATSSAVTLTWTDPTDSDFAKVEVLRNVPPSTAVSGTPIMTILKGVQKFVDSTVAASTAYTYILRAKDTVGNARNSDTISVTTPAAGAAPTTGVTAPAAPADSTTPAGPAAPATTGALTTGSMAKISGISTVYVVGTDGKRHPFLNERVFKTWYPNFSGVQTTTQTSLSAFTLGVPARYKAGVKMVKIQTDPKVYAVAPNGTLRWVTTEALAAELYGAAWNQKIDDVDPAFFAHYTVGDAITSAAQYSPAAATAADTL